jgi:hypothetical protein
MRLDTGVGVRRVARARLLEPREGRTAPLAEKPRSAESPLRVRSLDRVRPPGDPTILAKPARALARERVQYLAAQPRIRRSPRSDPA